MNTSTPTCQRIAVIGAGIAGLASAYFLARRHQVTLFEAGSYLGGHSNTVEVAIDGQNFPVDTGFLVFNHRTYPNLVALFAELGVDTYPSSMSFSVSVNEGALEWAGSSLDTLFAQRKQLFSRSFYAMLSDILRFNRQAAVNLAAAEQSTLSLGELLERGRYGQTFRQHYLLPMAAAIWSCPLPEMLQFPAHTFLRFCLNHGLLQIRKRPQWLTVAGGSREYVRRIAATLSDIRLATPVQRVERQFGKVQVYSAAESEMFDAVVFATHAPQTLALLADASATERALLAAQRYQPNQAVLHSDISLMPKRTKVWSAWNYMLAEGRDRQPACVSYWLNRLQNLPTQQPVILTLNPIQAPQHQIARFHYEHPLFDQAALAAQAQLPTLQGQRHTWFAGAWTGYGFHEDGLKSALRVAADFDVLPTWAQI